MVRHSAGLLPCHAGAWSAPDIRAPLYLRAKGQRIPSDHVRNRCTGGARSVLRRTGQGPHRNAEGPERIDGDASPLARRKDGPAE